MGPTFEFPVLNPVSASPAVCLQTSKFIKILPRKYSRIVEVVKYQPNCIIANRFNFHHANMASPGDSFFLTGAVSWRPVQRRAAAVCITPTVGRRPGRTAPRYLGTIVWGNIAGVKLLRNISGARQLYGRVLNAPILPRRQKRRYEGAGALVALLFRRL